LPVFGSTAFFERKSITCLNFFSCSASLKSCVVRISPSLTILGIITLGSVVPKACSKSELGALSPYFTSLKITSVSA